MAPNAKINQFFISSSSTPPWDLKVIISNIYLLLSQFSHVVICKVEILSTILLALFHAKFACILGNLVFRWESCKGSVWESVKKCSRLCKKAGTRDLILWVDHSLQAARSCTRAKHAKSWSVMLTVALQDKSPRLARLLARNLNSRLSPVSRPSRQTTLFGKIWLFAFLSHSTIYRPLYSRNIESF